jgi:hypothetical protein
LPPPRPRVFGPLNFARGVAVYARGALGTYPQHIFNQRQSHRCRLWRL